MQHSILHVKKTKLDYQLQTELTSIHLALKTFFEKDLAFVRLQGNIPTPRKRQRGLCFYTRLIVFAAQLQVNSGTDASSQVVVLELQPQFSRTQRNCRNAIEQDDLRAKMIDLACNSPYPVHALRKRIESFGKSDILCKNVLTFNTFDGILILARKEAPPHVHYCVR